MFIAKLSEIHCNDIMLVSLLGLIPAPHTPCYGASKHGVVGFTRSMLMCAHNDSVRVNCICPDAVDTRMVTDNMDVLGEFVASKGLIR